MLQQDAGDDYVIATGVSRIGRASWSRRRSPHVGLDPERPRRRRPRVRPPARPGAARRRPGEGARASSAGSRATSFEDLIGAMVEHDLRELAARAERLASERARWPGLPPSPSSRRRSTPRRPSGDAAPASREQDYPHVEHLVVDGGSTDGTRRDPRSAPTGVRCVSEPDRGLSHAMNKGIAMAGGAIVGWLNADDVYLPGALRAVGEAFAAQPGAPSGSRAAA